MGKAVSPHGVGREGIHVLGGFVVTELEYVVRASEDLLDTEPWRSHLEPEMVLQSVAIEEPYLVPQRTFQTRVL